MNVFEAALRELGFVVVGLACYLAVGWYAGDRTDQAISNALDLVALQEVLGLDWEHAVQDATLAVPGLGGFLAQFYFWGYFPTLLPTVGWLFVRHRDPYRTARNAVLVSGAVGFTVQAFYPLAPPWIVDDGFLDTVGGASVETLARPGGLANSVAAMPSFHCGWLVLIGLVVFRVTTGSSTSPPAWRSPSSASWSPGASTGAVGAGPLRGDGSPACG